MRRLFVNTTLLENGIVEKYGKLILTLSTLEWYVEESIILIILDGKFDNTKKTDLILADQIFKSTFDKKLQTIKKFNLLSGPLIKDLDKIRKRRNIFIHGVGINKNDASNMWYMSIISKGQEEPFTSDNITQFNQFVEQVGGKVLNEFEYKGFYIKGPPIT